MVTFPVCPGAIVPPVGTALHQLSAIRVVLVLHLSGLPPLLVMVTTWPVGLGRPWVLLKLKLSGEAPPPAEPVMGRSEEHTSELQSLTNLVCRLLLEKKKVHRSM